MLDHHSSMPREFLILVLPPMEVTKYHHELFAKILMLAKLINLYSVFTKMEVLLLYSKGLVNGPCTQPEALNLNIHTLFL
jgi:hypothetical protein